MRCSHQIFAILFTCFTNLVYTQNVRELYIDEVSNILSDTARYKEIIGYVEKYDLRNVVLYKYFEYESDTLFQKFLVDLEEAGIRQISAGFPVSYFALDEDGRKELLESLDVASLTFENDFWVTGNTFETYDVMTELGKHKPQNQLKLRIYFGWFGTQMNDNTMALRICKTFDEILIHHYRPGADFNYIESRLVTFGKAAMRYGRRQHVVIRISIDPIFFETMSLEILEEVYDKLEADFKAAKKVHKELKYIVLDGWQIYNSRYLKADTNG